MPCLSQSNVTVHDSDTNRVRVGGARQRHSSSSSSFSSSGSLVLARLLLLFAPSAGHRHVSSCTHIWVALHHATCASGMPSCPYACAPVMRMLCHAYAHVLIDTPTTSEGLPLTTTSRSTAQPPHGTHPRRPPPATVPRKHPRRVLHGPARSRFRTNRVAPRRAGMPAAPRRHAQRERAHRRAAGCRSADDDNEPPFDA